MQDFKVSGFDIHNIHVSPEICTKNLVIRVSTYSRSSRKRPPREFEKVVVTRAGRLRERALVSDHGMKQYGLVAYKSFDLISIMLAQYKY